MRLLLLLRFCCLRLQRRSRRRQRNDHALFNEAVAQNTLEDVGETAENIGGAIANEAEQTAEKVENKVGDVDVDVNVTRNGGDEHSNHQ